MRQFWLTLLGLAALGLAAAVAVVGLGLYNVSAQVGHLPGVSWVLHSTFRNSVRLRAPSMAQAPALDDPQLIALGAGHYATACAPCHAGAGTIGSATLRAMEPAPPPIDQAAARWQPNELHWIIENGIKMTGMPAWPAQSRGDEVWAVVAYLFALQSGSAPSLPDSASTPQAYCATCHGRIAGTVPRLDLHSAAYLDRQLAAYLADTRPSGIMAQAASVVPRARFGELAAHFAKANSTRPWGVPDAELVARGAGLAARGTRDVPACAACHQGEKGPELAGQPPEFIAAQLVLWRDGVYDFDPLMQAAARALSDADISAVAAFYAQ